MNIIELSPFANVAKTQFISKITIISDLPHAYQSKKVDASY